jgi:hypothetical protein
MANYRILGVNDEQNYCDKCGKTDLRATVVIEFLDADGNDVGTVRYGRSCATKITGKRPSVLGRAIDAAAAEVTEARFLLSRWSQYLEEDGVSLFYERNPHCAPGGRFAETPEEVTAHAQKIVSECQARLADVTG